MVEDEKNGLPQSPAQAAEGDMRKALPNPKRILTLALNGEYFDAIKAGTKVEEFRLVTPYWTKRLDGRAYDAIVLTRGYPKADDAERRLTLPWCGFTRKTITHKHFGDEAVEVFAIWVGDQEAFRG